MTQACCLTCQYWKRQRVTDNWGDCEKITTQNTVENHAILFTTNLAILRTRDVFYCAEFTQRKTQPYTIVDAAREAAANFKERSKT